MTTLDAAIGYAQRGWYVVPLHGVNDGRCSCGREQCSAAAKHPRTAHGLLDATTDQEQIAEWWSRWPRANVGIATGPSGLVVLDVDPRHGGDDSLAELRESLTVGDLDTLSVLTGGGGAHYYFTTGGATVRSGASVLGNGLDIRATGGYVVAPPSQHISGNAYSWEADDALLARLPATLAATLLRERSTRAVSSTATHAVPIPSGARNSTLASLAGSMRRTGMSADAIEAALAATNAERCDPPLEEREVRAIAQSVARYEASAPVADVSEDVDWDDNVPWPKLNDAALHGLAGDIVRAALPETEADSAAMLFSVLAAAGNAAGPGRRIEIADDRHPARLFVAIVGDTATGRKGTSWAAVRPFFRAGCAEWLASAPRNGFGSGEAIITSMTARHEDKGQQSSPDTRALIIEPEFARILSVNDRQGSTASPIIRQAWDTERLEVRRAQSHLVVEGAHVSLLAHITPDELRRKLTNVDIAGGFGNRFLFVCSRESKMLPSGGNLESSVIGPLAKRLASSIHRAQTNPLVLRRNSEAERLWHEIYCAEPARPGIVGEITARGRAQMLRLAVTYAILDEADMISVNHLVAAHAAWSYSVASAEHIFGGLLGGFADRLLSAIREAHPQGLDATAQRDAFGRHKSASDLATARAMLENAHLIETQSEQTEGRPRLVSRALDRAARAKSALSAKSLRPGVLNALNALNAHPAHADSSVQRAATARCSVPPVAEVDEL